ncbi:MAG: methionine adenosyltransferase [Alphaproteobacteria bacterium]
MNKKEFLFTSESVSEGHPDKVCDRISDSIVDLFLGKDPNARVAVETLATTNRVVLAGEVRANFEINPKQLEDAARNAVKEIGYEQDGFHWKNMVVENHIHSQSADIALGVDTDGAGDQGIMFGFAVKEDLGDDYKGDYMPAPIHFSHHILRSMAEARHSGETPEFLPDAKSQVTLKYVDGKPVGTTSIVVSTQHTADVDQKKIRELVRPHVLKVLPEGWMCDEDQFYVNPTGRFVIGGPDGDCGLTGRKIIVDTYGGMAPHGGGAFSGKDPTKVDRSAAYVSRYLAKNVVASGLAKSCLIQLSYAIGVAKPLSLYLDCNGTAKVDEAKIADVLTELVDLTPKGIIKHLNLRNPIYKITSSYGHFGRKPREDGSFSWEKTDLVDDLKNAF